MITFRAAVGALVSAGVLVAGVAACTTPTGRTAARSTPLPACPSGQPRIQARTGGPWVCDPDAPITPAVSPAWTPPPADGPTVQSACQIGYTPIGEASPFTAGPVPTQSPGVMAYSAPSVQVTVTSAGETVTVGHLQVAYYDTGGTETGSGDVWLGQTVTAGQTLASQPSEGVPAGSATCQVLSYDSLNTAAATARQTFSTGYLMTFDYRTAIRDAADKHGGDTIDLDQITADVEPLIPDHELRALVRLFLREEARRLLPAYPGPASREAGIRARERKTREPGAPGPTERRGVGIKVARTWLQRQLDFVRFDGAGSYGKRWGEFTMADYDRSITLTEGVIAAADARRELDTTVRSLLADCGAATTEEVPEHLLMSAAKTYAAARSADDCRF